MSDITELSLGAVRAEYVQYLKSHEYAETTARTSAYAAFYLWDRLGQDAFWDTVLSDDFENISKMYIESLYLKEAGRAGTDRVQWVNWRMAHLRRFRRFLQERSGETVPLRQLPQRALRKAAADGLDIRTLPPSRRRPIYPAGRHRKSSRSTGIRRMRSVCCSGSSARAMRR